MHSALPHALPHSYRHRNGGGGGGREEAEAPIPPQQITFLHFCLMRIIVAFSCLKELEEICMTITRPLACSPYSLRAGYEASSPYNTKSIHPKIHCF